MKTGAVIWFTGLPSSGKSTLARAVRAELARRGTPCALLDGDEVRASLVPRQGYDDAGRDAFYETLARLAALLAAQELIVLVPATAPRRAHRALARELAPRFVEVHLAASAKACASRDDKGLWAKARAGRLPALPGAGAAYEPPAHADVTVLGGFEPRAVGAVLAALNRAACGTIAESREARRASPDEGACPPRDIHA
jgi:adenylylsulfate kinase